MSRSMTWQRGGGGQPLSVSQFVQEEGQESSAAGPSRKETDIQLSSDSEEEDLNPAMPKRNKRIESSDSEGSDVNANFVDFNYNKGN